MTSFKGVIEVLSHMGPMGWVVRELIDCGGEMIKLKYVNEGDESMFFYVELPEAIANAISISQGFKLDEYETMYQSNN